MIIDVTPVNDAPGAFDRTLQATEDMPASSFFSTADGDSLVTTVELVTPPAHGTVTIPNPVGGALGGVSYTYTPSPNYNGPDTFTFRAVEAGLNSNVATVTHLGGTGNDAPVASSIVVTAQDGAVAGGLLQATTSMVTRSRSPSSRRQRKEPLTITDAATGAVRLHAERRRIWLRHVHLPRCTTAPVRRPRRRRWCSPSRHRRDGRAGSSARVASNGAQANADSFSVAVSADGRYVALNRTPRTSWRAIPTRWMTCSCATGTREP